MAEFTYKIDKHIATLSANGDITKELNLVSYGTSSPKWDIRTWQRKDGEVKLLKGLTLNDEELSALRDALNNLDI